MTSIRSTSRRCSTGPSSNASSGPLVDLTRVHLPSVPGEGGVVWSTSPGFHANLVVLGPHRSIEAHRNEEVDVLIVVIEGGGRISIDSTAVDVLTGDAVLVPSKTTRSIDAADAGLRYLSVHATRAPLTVGPRRAPGTETATA